MNATHSATGRQAQRRTLSSAGEVGRKRKSPLGAKIVNLGFKVDETIVRALDDEAARLNLRRAPGEPKLSRSDVIKSAIDAWLANARKRS